MSEWWSIDYDEGYDEGYRAGMQKMREVGQRRIEELEETLALRTNLHGEATYLIHKLEAKLAKAVGHLEKLDRLTARDAALVQAALAELSSTMKGQDDG